jgi:hypothetical protein
LQFYCEAEKETENKRVESMFMQISLAIINFCFNSGLLRSIDFVNVRYTVDCVIWWWVVVWIKKFNLSRMKSIRLGAFVLVKTVLGTVKNQRKMARSKDSRFRGT